ncbi:hypothetical protein [Bordetella petrii]|uniref:hypothetical protein n=1 Tax=Bordetella petrii TaxID=94624 RepID=UPI001E347A2A|nr:hypothetical protein [Bordetella petrii]MCD0502594.1 hypothetical protein [Bordetella petrii]
MELARYYEIRQAGCVALRAPTVRITAPPRLGRATVVLVQQMPVQTGRCGPMTVPVAQVRYRALAPGSDTLAWEVRYQQRGAGTHPASAQITVLPSRPAR